MLVCDHCGCQTQIHLDEKGADDKYFEISICIGEMNQVIKGNTFGHKYKSFTFCNKDCMLEYLKANMEMNGKLKGEG